MIKKIRVKGIKQKRNYNKKAVLALSTIFILITSYCAVFAAETMNAVDVFKMAFGDRAKYLGENAIIVEAKDTQQGITLSALAVAAY